MLDNHTGLLIVGLDYSSVALDEFNDWYDYEHIPERRRITGFLSAERWVAANNQNISIATYDLQSEHVLREADYQRIAGNNLSVWSKRVMAKCRLLCRFEGTQLFPGHEASSPDAQEMLLVAAKENAPDGTGWFDARGVPKPVDRSGLVSTRSFRTSDRTLVALYQYGCFANTDDSAQISDTGAPKEVVPAFSGAFWSLRCRRYARTNG